MAKIITAAQAASLIPSGARLMCGGFLGCGNPVGILRALCETDTEDLTLICDDAARPNGPDGDAEYGVAKLIHARKVRRMIGSHVGTNPEVSEQLRDGFLDLTLLPMGSFVEMIRAGGSGLGAVVTPTGVGTEVEHGPLTLQKMRIDDREHLVMRPLRADYAILSGAKVDRLGNVWYKGTTRNFSPWMAMAADVVIVEAEALLEPGEIPPEDVVTPGVLVDYIVFEEDPSRG